MKKSIILYTIIITNFFLVTSCKKFVEIGLPKDQTTTDNVFADSVNADAAIVGIYINMMQGFGFAGGGLTAYTGLSSDELYPTSATQNNEFFVASILPTNNVISSLWSNAYNYIYAANACVEGIENSTTLTASQRNVLLGEVLIIRAFMYFNLVNVYGDVPLVLTTDYEANRLKRRSAVSDVYDRIIEDLVKAKTLLPQYEIPSIRAGYYAATALLARVYLYLGDYEKAIAEADTVIRSGIYNLESDLDDVFLADSKEIIWGFSPIFPGIETWEGYYFIPFSTSSIPTYGFNDSFYNSFETDDERKNKWMRSNINNGIEYPIPYKYKLNSMTGTIKERYAVLRLAEQYLIRAEANLSLNNFADAEKDINKIRNRAGLDDISGSEPSLVGQLMQERKAELMSEWGHRWFDLRRTGLIDEVLLPLKPDWEPRASLFPIPQSEIDKNPNLTQNPGY